MRGDLLRSQTSAAMGGGSTYWNLSMISNWRSNSSGGGLEASLFAGFLGVVELSRRQRKSWSCAGTDLCNLYPTIEVVDGSKRSDGRWNLFGVMPFHVLRKSSNLLASIRGSSQRSVASVFKRRLMLRVASDKSLSSVKCEVTGRL